MRYLLDTSFLIASVLGKPKGFLPLKLRGSNLAISLISLAELYEGAFHHSDPSAVIVNLRADLSDFVLLPVAEAVCLRFGELRAHLRRAGRPHSDLDLLIAATALHHELTLVTRNLRDFEDIPDLPVASL